MSVLAARGFTNPCKTRKVQITGHWKSGEEVKVWGWGGGRIKHFFQKKISKVSI